MHPNAISESTTLTEKVEVNLCSSDGDSQNVAEVVPAQPNVKEKAKKISGPKTMGECVETGFASVAASITQLAASRSSNKRVESVEGKIISKLETMQSEQQATAVQQTA